MWVMLHTSYEDLPSCIRNGSRDGTIPILLSDLELAFMKTEIHK